MGKWSNRTPEGGSIPGCLVMAPAHIAVELGTLDMTRLVGLGQALTSLQKSAAGGERLTKAQGRRATQTMHRTLPRGRRVPTCFCILPSLRTTTFTVSPDLLSRPLLPPPRGPPRPPRPERPRVLSVLLLLLAMISSRDMLRGSLTPSAMLIGSSGIQGH